MACKREIALSIFGGLKTFYNSEELVDFQVKVGDVQFGCHRVILAASSDFFRGLFRSGMQETEQKSVTLKDISSDVFQSILESIYTGHVVLTNDNVIEIFKGAHQFQIHCIVSECEKFILNTFTEENYAEYFYIGYILESTGILETLWPLVLKNCYTFFKTNYFLQLPFSTVLRLIKSQDLCTRSEDDVIHAILRWVEFQNDQRQRNVSSASCDGITDSDRRDGTQEGGSGDELFVKTIDTNETLTEGNNLDNVVDIGPCDNQVEIRAKEKNCNHLLILLSYARLCLASQRCLQSLFTHSLVGDNKEVRDIVFDALLYIAGKRNGQWPSRAVHRNNSDLIHCLVDARKMGNDVEIRAYSLSTQKWLQLPGLVRVQIIQLAEVDNKLYALCTETTASGILCFRLHKGIWLQVFFLLYFCNSKYFHCAVVDACMYIFSTQDKVVYKLEVISRKIQELPGACKYKDIVYIAPYDQWILVFYNSTDALFQCYDTLQNTWGNVNKFEGSSKGMTSFKDDHFTYILQSNGNLWNVVKPHSDTIDFEFVVKLWSSDRALYGAVTFLEELYIHSGAICDSNSDSDDEANDDDDIYIRRSLPGAFCKIHYLESKYTENSLSVGLPITLASNFFVYK